MSKSRFIKTLLIFAGCCAGSAMLSAQPKLNADNIDEVLQAMTLEEKATMSIGVGWGMQLGGITGSSISLVPGAAGTTNAIPRLGIPATALPDGPAGVRINPTREGSTRTYYATGFPIGTALASSWDVDLVEEVTTAMGNEVLEYGADLILAPAMNIHRNPLCGRNFEYFSEDPLLSGKIGAAYIRGIQSNGVGTSVKHFAANNQETNRNENDSRISIRALREIYLKGFEIAIKEAKPWTVMSSYNKLNGEYTQQSKSLLTNVLRDEWGFEGIVMTDWGSKEGTVAAVAAGNDLMMPGSDIEKQRIIDAVNDGTLSEADLDRNVRRILEYIVKTPHFRNYNYSDSPDLDAHAQIVRRAGAETMVLLKNDDDLLPLKAGSRVALFGISSVDFVAGGTGSGNVNKSHVIDLVQGLEEAGFELCEELKDFNKKYVDYKKAETQISGRGGFMILGTTKIPEASLPRSFVNSMVNQSDISIVVIGRNSGEGDDRTVDNDFNLTAEERQLLEDVAAASRYAGKKMVVILNVGGVIETASWKNLPDAILLAWQPGQEGGYSVADVLTGKTAPSGRLPMTFPLSYIDHPSSVNFPQGYEERPSFFRRGGMEVRNYDYTDYAEDIWVGYRWFSSADEEVSYPFGYGLGYTEFSYSVPKIKASQNGGFTAEITVTNVGNADGKEVVQLYVAAPAGGMEKPAVELKAFAKTGLLSPGQSQTLEFEVDPYSLASFDEQSNCWVAAPGNYTLYFSKDVNTPVHDAKFNLRKEARFEVTSAFVVPSATSAE